MTNLRTILHCGALQAAPNLLGCILKHHTASGLMAVIITETEAYTEDDPASHSFAGRTFRNAAMFGPPGSSYAYFTYGMHYCFNIAAGSVDSGEAVLVRAVEPLTGLEIMWQNRYHEPLSTLPPRIKLKNLCNGPAKLVQALTITKRHDGLNLLDNASPLRLLPNPSTNRPLKTINSRRIGLSKATDKLWRWRIAPK